MLAVIEDDAQKAVGARERDGTRGVVSRIIGSARRDFERRVTTVLRDYLERSRC
jgi:hypothetical protein